VSAVRDGTPPAEGSGVATGPACSDEARRVEAPLAGTASRADLFLLVEHHGAWGPRAVEESDLPPAAADWLAGQLAALAEQGRPRALFIRRHAARAGAPDGVRCFLAVAREERQELFAFRVARHEELAGIELAAGLRAGALGAHRSEERLTLVCVNGRRDRCCAVRGRAVIAAMAAAGEDETAWTSTHQGGHRHAAVGLWLPEAVSYGYLEADDVAALRAARQRRALHLPRFRGRTFHSVPAQAADALLRRELGVDVLDAWRPSTVEEGPAGSWRIGLAGPAGRWEVQVERGEEEALVSCSPPKRQRIERFSLRSWRPV
jgi:hypothetical protein